MLSASRVVAVLAFAASALAHGGVTSLKIGSTTYQGWQPFSPAQGQVTAGRPYSSYNPILSPTDSTLHCNDDGNTGVGATQQTLNIAAGAVLTAVYPQWTHAEGPYTVYLAACPSSGCNSVNSATAKWFKIYELGLINGTVYKGSWANGLLMANLKWDVTIPSNLLAGNYLIRFETLALHQSNTPQFYPECAQINVSGSGTAFPTSEYLVSIPGAWKASDPGVTIDIYSTAAQTTSTYLIPGPRVYPGFANYAPPPNLPGSSPSSPSPSGSAGATTVKTTSTSTATAPTGTPVPHYGQCGGIGWTGSTVCASPYACVKNGDYYSQCV